MNHQHNPDYLSNGNIIVADSENNRIIEINKTTKEIVWTYEENLKWCRDANELPEDIEGDYLISDTDRIFIIDKESKEVVWQFKNDILQAYSTEFNAETKKILVDCSFLGKIMEIDYETKKIVWEFGDSILRELIFLDCSMFIAFFTLRATGISLKFKKVGKERMKNPKRSKIFLILSVTMVIFLSFVLIFHLQLLRVILFEVVKTHDIG